MRRHRPDGGFYLTLALGAVVLVMVVEAGSFPPQLRIVPYLAGYPTLALILVLLIGQFVPQIGRFTDTTLQDLWDTPDRKVAVTGGQQDAPWPAVLRIIAYAVGFLAGVFLFGFFFVPPVFIALYLIREAEVRLLPAVLTALVASVGTVLGIAMLRVEIWPGVVPEIVPGYLGGAIMPPL